MGGSADFLFAFGSSLEADPLPVRRLPVAEKPMRAKMVAIVGGAVAACLLISPALPGQTVAVAGLLGGNTLVPLAQFDGSRWVRTWPAPGEQTDRKLNGMTDIPHAWFPTKGGIPREWFVWTEDVGGIPVRALAPKVAEAHCEGVWGLGTRLPASGHETTAIATSRRTGISAFARSVVGPGSDTRIATFLGHQFEDAETAAVRTSRKDADAVLEQRPACDPVSVLHCAGIDDEDGQVCAFEASRLLGTKPANTDPDCLEVTVVQGWYRSTPSDLHLLQISGVLTDCDGKGHRSVTPMVLIKAGNRSFVVAEEHGYEDEDFAVHEVRDQELREVLRVAGGGC